MIVLAVIITLTLAACFAVIVYAAKCDAEKSFSCPNCGEIFRLSTKQLIPVHIKRQHFTYKRILRCPVCQKKDICKVLYADGRHIGENY